MRGGDIYGSSPSSSAVSNTPSPPGILAANPAEYELRYTPRNRANVRSGASGSSWYMIAAVTATSTVASATCTNAIFQCGSSIGTPNSVNVPRNRDRLT